MQSTDGAAIDPGKAQVVDRVPKVIKELKFGVLWVPPLSDLIWMERRLSAEVAFCARLTSAGLV